MTNIVKKDPIDLLYQSKKTVFSLKDLSLYWQIENPAYLKTKTKRLVKSGRLLFIRRGFYALDKNYDRWELANKMITPSYVGLYTILTSEGTNFQYDSRIYCASRQSRTIYVGEQGYVYQKLNDKALLNPVGLKFDGAKTVATKERAIMDTIYLMPNFGFDKLINVDWKFCSKIAKIYRNKQMSARLKQLKEDYAE